MQDLVPWQSEIDMEAFGGGIALGLVLSLLLGPVFFALLQISLAHGFRAGAKMVAGIAASDLFFILICYFGLAPIASTPVFQYWMGIIGGGIMMAFGLASVLKLPAKASDADKTIAKLDGWKLVLRAFVLNGLNPFVLIFWLTTTSNVITRYPAEPMNHCLFFVGMVMTAIGTDLAKAYAAKRLSSVMKPELLRYLTIGVGIALFIFGARTIYKVWYMI